MKCPGCGAEVTKGKYCEFCGTAISSEMRLEQEKINKVGCPKCGSSNITFNREKQAEFKGKNGTAIIRSTVGVCKDCGYTWETSENAPAKRRKTWLWVLGWICIFPIPLTILMLRKKDMKPALKYGIIAVAWILYFIIGAGVNSDKQTQNNDTQKPMTAEASVVNDVSQNATEQDNVATATDSTQLEKNEKHLYDNAQVRDVMNGFRDTKIGEYAVIYASSEECTEEALADLYFNYYKKNDFNWITLIYTDKNDNTGVYVNAGMLGVNDQFILDEFGDYSVGESPDEIIYVPNDDGVTLTRVEFSQE